MSTDPSRPMLASCPPPEAVARGRRTRSPRSCGDAIGERGVAHWATTGGSARRPSTASSGRRRCARRSTGEASTSGGATTGSCRPITAVQRHAARADPARRGGDEATSGVRTPTIGETGSASAPRGPPPPDPDVARRSRTGPGPRARPPPMPRRSQTIVARGRGRGAVVRPVVLGVGPDGHLLSVFPGSEVWDTGTNVAASLPHPCGAARRAGDDPSPAAGRGTAGARRDERRIKAARSRTGVERATTAGAPDPGRPGPERHLAHRRGGRRGAAAGAIPAAAVRAAAGRGPVSSPVTRTGARPSGGRSRPAGPGTAPRSPPRPPSPRWPTRSRAARRRPATPASSRRRRRSPARR